jgi:Flp pilus assembly protein TadG
MMLAALGATLAALLGFTALAVDVANAYVVREILQNAVDDGARTAQRWSAQVDDPGVDPAAVQAQAVAAAVGAAQRDIQAHGLARVTVVDTALAGSRLRIAARASVPTWFLRALGITRWRPAASSEIALWTAASSAAASSPGAPAPAVTTPTFPSASGPIPVLTLPELPEGEAGSGGGVQQSDAAPGPDAGDGSPGTPGDSTGPAGGDIAEGL